MEGWMEGGVSTPSLTRHPHASHAYEISYTVVCSKAASLDMLDAALATRCVAALWPRHALRRERGKEGVRYHDSMLSQREGFVFSQHERSR